MKVLLLCLAFAAVSLAMPVGEEKPDVGAPPPPISKTEAAETAQADAPAAPVVEKLPEVLEVKEPEKQPEVKKEIVESQPEVKEPEIKEPEVKEPETPKPEESAGRKNDEIVLENKSSEADPAPKPEEPKPEIVQPADAKPEEKSADAEAKPAEEPKPTEVPATVNEVPKDASAKSAVPEESIDIVNAIKTDAGVSEEVRPVVLIPTPEKKIDLPVLPGVDAEAPKDSKDESPASVQEPAKPEEKKPEEPKPENISAEPSADAALAPALTATKPDEPAALSEDSLRVVRGTADDLAAATEAPKDDVKPTEAAKVEEVKISKEIVEQKKEEPAKSDAEVPEAAEAAPTLSAATSTDTAAKAPVNEMKDMNDKTVNDKPDSGSSESQESGEKKDKDSSESSEEQSE